VARRETPDSAPVTGDKADLLALGKHGMTRIITARQFHDELGL
jgi:hypothetical protein